MKNKNKKQETKEEPSAERLKEQQLEEITALLKKVQAD